MHTLVIMFKEGMPIFPYSIKYENELIHYKLHNDGELYKILYPGEIQDVKLIEIEKLNGAIRHASSHLL